MNDSLYFYHLYSFTNHFFRSFHPAQYVYSNDENTKKLAIIGNAIEERDFIFKLFQELLAHI